MSNISFVFHNIPESSIEEWGKYARELGIVFVDDSPEPTSLILTRYTLDKMDENWNKILTDDF